MLRPLLATLFPYTTLFRSEIDEVFKVHGRGDREYVLSLSHEETFALIAKEIRSYKELARRWQRLLRRDLAAAAGVFHHGPRALRDLRIRSGHRPRLLDRAA